MLYRIHTENKNKNWLLDLVSEYFPGFSVYEQTGYWQGQPEQSLCIEIDCNMALSANESHIRFICESIKGHNNQQSVMLQQIEVKTEFI